MISALAPAAGAILIVFVSNGQAAPTDAQKQAIRASCRADYRTYCADVPPGGLPSLQCLEKNLASLSPSCQQAVKAANGG
jgi:hypothetical protein